MYTHKYISTRFGGGVTAVVLWPVPHLKVPQSSLGVTAALMFSTTLLAAHLPHNGEWSCLLEIAFSCDMYCSLFVPIALIFTNGNPLTGPCTVTDSAESDVK